MFDSNEAISDYTINSSHCDDIKRKNILIYEEILNSDYKYTTYIKKNIYFNIQIIYPDDANILQNTNQIIISTKEWKNYLDSIIDFYRNQINNLNETKKIKIIIDNKLLFNYITIFHNEHIIIH